MRILIASDIHGSASRAAMFREKIDEMKPDQIILLGDLLYHGPRNPLPDVYSPAEVVEILGGLKVPIIAVRGNCDGDVDQFVLPFHLAESAWITDGHYRILAIHGHQLPEKDEEIKVPEGTAVLSGHIHIPVAERRGLIHRWNPGSTSLPKEDYPPSFGLYEDGKFQALDFKGNVLKSDSLK
ncbi:phosphodiesterase [Deltaproteobacteria bacterium Smac51]|nr:phosphodiesterase [Deltaproteobacteria bacterium Smac51]